MTHTEKLEEAKRRYGKPFLLETPLARKEPPSPRLMELNQLSNRIFVPECYKNH